MKQNWTTNSATETKKLAHSIGKNLQGSETIVFKSDLGGGKTTFVSGLVKGFGSDDPVASPTFVISSVYFRPDKKEFHHFDFYRLDDPGIITQELAEVAGDGNSVVVVEWGDGVKNVIPKTAITVTIRTNKDDSRSFEFEYEPKYKYLFNKVKS